MFDKVCCYCETLDAAFKQLTKKHKKIGKESVWKRVLFILLHKCIKGGYVETFFLFFAISFGKNVEILNCMNFEKNLTSVKGTVDLDV